MNIPENALPLGGLAKPTLKQPTLYETDCKDRCALALALLLSLLTVEGLLWYGPAAGCAVSVYVFYAVILFYLGSAPFRRRENQVLLLSNLLLATTFLVSSNRYFRGWNFLALCALLPIHAASLSGAATLAWWQPAMFFERLKLLWSGWFCNLGATPAALCSTGSNRKHLASLLLGGGLAVVLVALLLPVLASADALFAAATAELRDWVRIHFTAALWKGIIALAMTPFLFGWLYRLRRPVPLNRRVKSHSLDALVFLILLLALDALYLTFLVVQSAGLFGGALARHGLSYADWARSGFFQMVGVTVVNLSALLAAVTLSRREGKLWNTLRLAAALLLTESLALLCSACWRMTRYVSAYGLSFKRCMTYWGMGMMLLFFLFAGWKLHRPDSSFYRMAFPVALAGWLLINCIPLDFLVARDNVNRYLDGRSETVSIHYLLYNLSFDSIAQLRRLDGSLHPFDCDNASWFWLPEETLATALGNRRQFAREQCQTWQTWNLSAYLAADNP